MFIGDVIKSSGLLLLDAPRLIMPPDLAALMRWIFWDYEVPFLFYRGIARDMRINEVNRLFMVCSDYTFL